MKKTRILSAFAALLISAALTGCASDNAGGDRESVNSDNAGSYTTADVQALLDAVPDVTTYPTLSEEDYATASLASATDVENEVDRAIYKTSLVLPEGWVIREDSKDGKVYTSPTAQLKIQAVNYGEDAELADLGYFADSVAASIKVNNMYLRADTDYSDPINTTVAGNPAVRYDYVVSAYFFERDEMGNAVGEKQLFATYPGRLYVFYNGTDGYMMQFESDSDHIDSDNKDFDAIIGSMKILDDGTEGYQSASVYMSIYEEYSISAAEAAFQSQVEADLAEESRSKAEEESRRLAEGQ